MRKLKDIYSFAKDSTNVEPLERGLSPETIPGASELAVTILSLPVTLRVSSPNLIFHLPGPSFFILKQKG